MLSATGEVSSLVYAENLLNVIEALDDAELAALLAHLLDTHDINAPALATAATNYANAPAHDGIEIIANAAEPGWMELFRRLNATTNGTVRLVHFRQRLLDLMRNHPDFRRIDGPCPASAQLVQPLDFLFWNQSTGRPLQISWKKSSPMRRSMKLLHGTICRARLAPEDRRCFAFFHPAMPNEPLIFVEVALTKDIPERIDDVLALNRDTDAASAATTAAFYSISNCQSGWRAFPLAIF